MEATLDKFGRIVIPKRVREECGLAPGTVLEIEWGEGRIVLSPRADQPDMVREDGVLVFTGEAVGDLGGTVEAHRNRRSREVVTQSAR